MYKISPAPKDNDGLSDRPSCMAILLNSSYHHAVWNIKFVTPFDIEMSPQKYEKSHCGDMKTIFTHNGHSYTCKMASLYWSFSLISQSHDTGLYHSYHKRQHDSQLALWASKARGMAVPCQGIHAPMPLYQFSIDYSGHHYLHEKNISCIHLCWTDYWKCVYLRYIFMHRGQSVEVADQVIFKTI